MFLNLGAKVGRQSYSTVKDILQFYYIFEAKINMLYDRLLMNTFSRDF
jgi:hypothetical protein